MAIEAELLCRLDGRPHHQSGSRTLHGQAHGSQDHRGEGKPPVADLPSRRHRRLDPGSSRTAGLASQPSDDRSESWLAATAANVTAVAAFTKRTYAAGACRIAAPASE